MSFMKCKFSLRTIIASALVLFSVTFACAQDKPVKFGFDLGLGYANQWGNAYDAYSKSGIFSFTFGADVDINIAEKSFIEVGVNFNRKGSKINGHHWIEENGGPWKLYTEDDKTTVNMFYLQIPIMYGINLPIEQDISWKFMIGPYIGVGLTGDRRNEYTSPQVKEINEILGRTETVSTFTEHPIDFSSKRIDVGAKAQTGVTVDRISYMIAYELGFFNTLRESETIYDKVKEDLTVEKIGFNHGYKSRNSSIMLIVSFRF